MNPEYWIEGEVWEWESWLKTKWIRNFIWTALLLWLASLPANAQWFSEDIIQARVFTEWQNIWLKFYACDANQDRQIDVVPEQIPLYNSSWTGKVREEGYYDRTSNKTFTITYDLLDWAITSTPIIDFNGVLTNTVTKKAEKTVCAEFRVTYWPKLVEDLAKAWQQASLSEEK